MYAPEDNLDDIVVELIQYRKTLREKRRNRNRYLTAFLEFNAPYWQLNPKLYWEDEIIEYLTKLIRLLDPFPKPSPGKEAVEKMVKKGLICLLTSPLHYNDNLRQLLNRILKLNLSFDEILLEKMSTTQLEKRK